MIDKILNIQQIYVDVSALTKSISSSRTLSQVTHPHFGQLGSVLMGLRLLCWDNLCFYTFTPNLPNTQTISIMAVNGVFSVTQQNKSN